MSLSRDPDGRVVRTDSAPDFDDRFVVAQPVAATVPVVERYVAQQPVASGMVATTTGRSFAFDSFIVGLVGLALTILGLIAATRAGFDGSMNEPVVEVLGFTHTATLGLIEAAIGICLLISAAATSRAGAVFFGLVLGIGAFVGAVQSDSFSESLALEKGLAWLAVVAAVIVVLASLLIPRMVTRTDRVEAI
jgi:hypothetical protein